jgi:hypothetical protein
VLKRTAHLTVEVAERETKKKAAAPAPKPSRKRAKKGTE